MCRIPETYPDQHYSSSEDEYYDGYISEPSTLHMKARNRFRMKRTGGSLSLSENEFDSDDLEMPVPFNLSEKTRERLNSASNKAKEEEAEAGVEAVAKSQEGSPSRSTGSEGTSDAVDGKERDECALKESTGGDKDEEQEDYVELVK